MNNPNILNTRLINLTMAIIATTLVVYIFNVGRSILLPIIAAIVICYLIIRLMTAFSRVPFTSIRIPMPIALILSLIATCLIIYGLINLITHSINGIVHDASKYQQRLTDLIAWVNNTLHIKLNISELLKKVNFTSIFTNLAVSITFLSGNLALILVYVLFLLVEYKTFNKKIQLIFKDKDGHSNVDKILNRISSDINTYMKVKAGVSVLTGVASYIVLVSVGINYAGFWAVLIFLLNFIPTIGSIIAVIFTLIAVSIQITTWGTFLLLAALLILVQFIVGNIIEPKFMGKNLNLSPLVILISLGFWGSIWGILGMFLCVPLMTILNIILARFDQTRHLAILFAANPESL